MTFRCDNRDVKGEQSFYSSCFGRSRTSSVDDLSSLTLSDRALSIGLSRQCWQIPVKTPKFGASAGRNYLSVRYYFSPESPSALTAIRHSDLLPGCSFFIFFFIFSFFFYIRFIDSLPDHRLCVRLGFILIGRKIFSEIMSNPFSSSTQASVLYRQLTNIHYEVNDRVFEISKNVANFTCARESF